MIIRSCLLLIAAVVLAACSGSSPSGAGQSSSSSGSSASASSSASSSGGTQAGAPAISQAPTAQSVALGQSATFSVTATGNAPLSYQWQKNGVALAGATTSSYQTPATAAADDGANFSVVISNAVGSITSANATLQVTGISNTVDVLTYHNDNARTAQNLAETLLTPANVKSSSFGLLRILPADGLVDAQPLIVSNIAVAGTVRNVVYVATEHGSVYGYDADTGVLLVQVNLIPSGESTSDDRGCSQVTPEIGITATPVIDRSAGAHGTLYAVAMSKDSSGKYHQRLHALDLVTLAEQSGSPVSIQASYPGTGANSSQGNVIFDPAQYKERAALLLVNGTIYTAWSSHCDIEPYTGWIMAYNGHSLSQSAVLNVTPNGSEGAIWQAGGGLAADAAGNIFALVGNGSFDTTLDGNGRPSGGDYGNAFIKVSTASGLAVSDYFAEYNAVGESDVDADLGSGAPMLLPAVVDSTGTTRNLAVGAGKDGHLYVVNRDAMGGFNPAGNGNWQDLSSSLPGGVFSAPAYFNGTVYYADVGSTLKAFPVGNARVAANPSSQSGVQFGYPGASPSVSANGTSGGIVWALQSTAAQLAVLHAFDASNLANELYNSNQAAAARDQFGSGNKFITPTIANGKVYVGTPNGVAVFGLL